MAKAKTPEEPQERKIAREWLINNVFNMLLSRDQYVSGADDPRRNINDECGYPDSGSLDANYYQELYERDTIAKKVVEFLPKQCWRQPPTIFESEDPDERTPFELSLEALSGQLRGGSKFKGEQGNPMWTAFKDVDLKAGIGDFGVLFLGFNDKQNYSLPVQASETLQLNFLTAYPESLVKVANIEQTEGNPRFGQPTEYSIQFSDPRANKSIQPYTVHWSRVIHVPSEQNVSRMKNPLNRLRDLQKIYGADGEAYWRGAVIKLFLETPDNFQGQVDKAKIADEMENMLQGLQQWALLKNLKARTVPPQVVDPQPHADAHIQAICIGMDAPQRIFMGSERGNLASSQDMAHWNGVLKERGNNYCTPMIIIPFIDRMIELKVLKEPTKGYFVEWPDTTTWSEEDIAAYASKVTSSLVQYVTGGVETLMSPMDYLQFAFKLDDKRARAMLERAANQVEGDTDLGGSRLLGFVGGITAMVDMFQKHSQGIITTETLKQMIMLFYKINEDKANAVVADTDSSIAVKMLRLQSVTGNKIPKATPVNGNGPVKAQELPIYGSGEVGRPSG